MKFFSPEAEGNSSLALRFQNIILILGWIVGLALFVFSFRTVLNGPHQHRQADSIAPGYFYCTEDHSFLYPHIGPRGTSPGVAINEFPLYAYALGQICQWTGSWSESTPKVLSLIMALAAGLLFALTLQKRWGWTSRSRVLFLTLFIFLPVHWTFFTIPMPDSTALFFIAGAGWLWEGGKNSLWKKIIAVISFCLGFLIRPYYILLLFFYFPGVLISGVVLVLCLGLFWLWYRYWNSVATTNPGYFGIQFQSKEEIWAQLPRALSHLPTRILEHTSLVGLISFPLIWKRHRQLVLFYAASVLMMYVLKSTHVAAHGYYLLNASVFAAFALTASLQEMKLKHQNLFLGFFLLYTFSSTQHNFHANGNWTRTQKALEEFGNLDPGAVVATYLGPDPEWLYYLKRTGFIFSPEEFQGQCPPGATHILRVENINEKDSPLHLALCPQPKIL